MAADYVQVNRLFKGLVASHAEFDPRTVNRDAQLSIAEFAELARRSALVVAAAGQEVLGFMHIETIRVPPIGIFNERHIFEIRELFVDEPFRSLGLGKALIDMAKQAARDTGAGVLQVGAFSVNRRARKFYERMRFEEPGRMFCYYL